MNNLTLLLYTNSKVQDLHNIFFSQIKRYFPSLVNVVILSDISIPNYTTSLYTEDIPYWKQILQGLDLIKTDFVLYCQEDYILYDTVNTQEINNILNILQKNTDVGFVRLIQSGIENSKDYNDSFLELNPNHQYFFSTQATIWKKETLNKLFQASKVSSIRDECKNSHVLCDLGYKGLCTKLQGQKVGGHYNSLIFPYVATALVQGKWNFSEYQFELENILAEYKIDIALRGLR